MEQPSGIGRYRFEVSPLRLGIQGSEGQRSLSGAGHARENNQSIARDLKIDVLEIVLASPADADETHSFLHSRRRSALTSF